MPTKITESDLKKMIEQEVDNYTNKMNPQVKDNKIADVISKIYQMIMKGEIEKAKEALASNPEIQEMADELADITYRIGSELRHDDNFLKHISKIVDEM